MKKCVNTKISNSKLFKKSIYFCLNFAVGRKKFAVNSFDYLKMFKKFTSGLFSIDRLDSLGNVSSVCAIMVMLPSSSRVSAFLFLLVAR